MEPDKQTFDRRLGTGLLIAFAVVATLAASDVLADLTNGSTVTHILTEVVVFGVGLAGSIVIGQRLLREIRSSRQLQSEATDLAERLQRTEAEAARWRSDARDLVAGLSDAIDRQFQRWSLTPAEREVALLLLKGLSHKEIAKVRSISEATARQQARAVYRKAGLHGRADLAAFFLEDLLVPSDERT